MFHWQLDHADPATTASMQEKVRMDKFQDRMGSRMIEAQRASATTPISTVHLYKQLAQAGLQYGPSFRLLRNVHVPDPKES
jgi:hypothetical protein